MKWRSAISNSKALDHALEECLAPLRKNLSGKAHFAAFFVSSHFEKEYKRIHKEIQSAFPDAALIGCSGGGIIGNSKEIENHPAIGISVAHMPGVKFAPFRVEEEDMPDLDASPKEWHELLGVDPASDPSFILLADPFSINIEDFALGIDYAYPHSVKIGGLASGAQQPGKNALFLNDGISHSGLAGIALSGNVRLDALVAQGCKPIGELFQITGCEQNVLYSLNGQPPLVVLQEIYETLPDRDKELLQHSLFLGIVSDSAKTDPGPGDFLIRNILAADPEKGILSVGSMLRVGQSVRFHLRDAETSREDLESVLRRYSSAIEPEAGASDEASHGVLLFSCAGRGAHLYGQANHDSEMFHSLVGKWPIAGFFCNGEIGPVGKTTYIHGYTSCFGVLREKKASLI